jgi:hypothetical protein
MFARCFDAFSNPSIIFRHPFHCSGRETHFIISSEDIQECVEF